MARVPENKSNPEVLQFIVQIVALEQKAHQLGFHETGHALNKASQTIGWEIDGKLKRKNKGATS